MKIGILGGGQLGRMMIQESLKYDDEIHILDPNSDCSCALISHFTQGNFNSKEAVFNFAKEMDVVSIEIEHVSVEGLEQLENEGVNVIPTSRIIKIIQQKILQKKFYQQHEIPSPEFQIVYSKKEKIKMDFPFVQKLNTGGYDGKGVQVIHDENDLEKFWDEPSVLEKLVDIEKELSLIIGKNEKGEIKSFPVTEMVADPKLNLLDFNISPAQISSEVQQQIDDIAEKLLTAANSAGLFAIELFLDKDGKVWVNETAPRLHNSGHQSQEGNANSQFEQFYRILKNQPLADVDPLGFSGMVNLVGEDNFSGNVKYKGLDEVLKLKKTYVHLYGKSQTKPGRKMGHINVLADSRAEVLEKLVQIKSLVKVVSD
jgi:5-(carboxyamino)imidazole ribonucleotide synthase